MNTIKKIKSQFTTKTFECKWIQAKQLFNLFNLNEFKQLLLQNIVNEKDTVKIINTSVLAYVCCSTDIVMNDFDDEEDGKLKKKKIQNEEENWKYEKLLKQNSNYP